MKPKIRPEYRCVLFRDTTIAHLFCTLKTDRTAEYEGKLMLTWPLMFQVPRTPSIATNNELFITLDK